MLFHDLEYMLFVAIHIAGPELSFVVLVLIAGDASVTSNHRPDNSVRVDPDG